MKNTLFKYTLYDAWWQKYSSLEILDKPYNSVVLVKKDEKTIISVNREFIEKIKDTIKKFDKLEEIKCCDIPPILDGSINKFEVKINNKIHEIDGYNLWWFLDKNNIQRYKANKNYSPNNSILLIEFYEEIIKLLTKNYIDTEYMSLRI